MTQPFRAGIIGAAPASRDGRPGEPGIAARLSGGGEAPRGLFDDLMADFQDAFGYFNPFGPARPPAPGRAFLERRHDGPAGSRGYRLYVPSRAEAGVALPLVVMLHGCNQSAEDFAVGTRMNLWAERDGFMACYPAQTSAANGQRCWNWYKDADQRRGAGEPAVVVGIVRDVMAEFAVDPDRVYAAGLSAGGALAATLGRRYPDLFAAVGVHSGLACGAARDVGSALQAMRQGGGPHTAEGGGPGAPAIVFHGDRDATVNPVNADEVAAQALGDAAVRGAAEDGAVPGGHAYRRTRFIGADGTARVEQWEVRGAGHAWSGGSPAGSHTDPQGPDASGEMLRFFAEHAGTRPAR